MPTGTWSTRLRPPGSAEVSGVHRSWRNCLCRSPSPELPPTLTKTPTLASSCTVGNNVTLSSYILRHYTRGTTADATRDSSFATTDRLRRECFVDMELTSAAAAAPLSRPVSSGAAASRAPLHKAKLVSIKVLIFNANSPKTITKNCFDNLIKR